MYPALAVHSALVAKKPSLDTLWVGGEGGMEESLVKRQGIPFQAIPAAGVHGVGLTVLPRNLVTITRGFFAARRILSEFKPDVMFFTGGYVAVPVAMAGRSIPSLLYVPDIEPGMAIKSLAGMADVIAVTTAESQQFFNKKVRETGYPLRADLARWDRQTASQHLGISGKGAVLLFFGGSKGAHSINVGVLNNLRVLLSKYELIHITGEADWQLAKDVREQLPTNLAARYHAMPYLHEMGAALAAADGLAGLETEASQGSNRAQLLPLVLGQMRLGGILNYRESVLAGEGHGPLQVPGLPHHVNRHDRPSVFRYPSLDVVGIELVRGQVQVSQYGHLSFYRPAR